MKKIILISLIVYFICGCSHFIPMKVLNSYFEKISYKPNSYKEIAGKYTTGPNLSGITMELFSDSTFHYKSWGDIKRYENEENKGIYGKYIISGDTLLLLSDGIVYIDSTNINQNNSIATTLKNIKSTFFRFPYLFVNIENYIYIIGTNDKENYIENYYSIRSIEESIKNKPKKVK